MSNERFGVDGARWRNQFATRLRATVQRPTASQNHTSEARVADTGARRPEVKDALDQKNRERIDRLAREMDIHYTEHGDVYRISKWTERTLRRHAAKSKDVVFHDVTLEEGEWDRPGFLMLLRAAYRGRAL